jgi:hypothetical protein
MNAAQLSDWLQVVGLFGVIASLIFVGLQMKQAHEIASASTYQARATAAMDSDIGAINSPEFLSAMAKVYDRDFDSLSAQEVLALDWWFASFLVGMENTHLQFEAGFLPEEHYLRSYNQMVCWFELPFFRDLSGYEIYRASFNRVIRDAIDKSINNPSGCWDFDWDYPLAE